MGLPIYIVDAFTARPFGGNPAAVVLLREGRPTPDEQTMARIAQELNLPETAFLRFDDSLGPNRFGLRWFTSVREVDLCGHATLAAAHTLYDAGKVNLHTPILFDTRSGVLRAAADADWGGFTLDFPATPPRQADAPAALLEAIGLDDLKFAGRSAPPDGYDDRSQNDYYDWFLVADDVQAVRNLAPDFRALSRLLRTDPESRGVIVSAADGVDGFDVVSRCFYPTYGIDEDPVTGSAHCTIGPYFARVLDRPKLRCQQASERGGEMGVRVEGDRVFLSGRSVSVMRGELLV